MSESSEPVRQTLESWRKQLQTLADSAPDAAVPPAHQLEIENAIAAGVAELASEPTPTPAAEWSGRPILAKDLLITTDLVLRALRSAGA